MKTESKKMISADCPPVSLSTTGATSDVVWPRFVGGNGGSGVNSI